MENHPTGNAGIKQTCKDVPLVICQTQHVNAFLLDIFVQIAEQTFSAQHVVINCQLRILLLEIFLDAHQLDFIPRTLLRIVAQMDERYFKMIILESRYQ